MESAIAIAPFGKSTAPGAVKLFEGREVIQTFRDPLFGEFRIFKTGGHRVGFWEDDPSKVQKLIDAFKTGHNLKNALFYAGIKEMAWYRFIEVYPVFREIKEACSAQTSFRTMNSFQEAIPTKPELAFKYMEKRGDFNFETRKVGEEAIVPTVNVGVQVNNNFDETKFQTEVRGAIDKIISEASPTSEGRSGDGVAEVSVS